MWNWLIKRLRPPVTSPHASQPIQCRDSFSAVSEKDGFSSEEISETYYGLILGIHSRLESSFNAVEIEVLNELEKMLSSPESLADLVPRLPDVVPQLMQSLRDEDISGSQLARQIAKDVALVGEIIRITNSPYYRTRNRIKSLEQAVTVLGRNGFSYILVNAAFKPIMNLQHGHFTRIASGYIWRQSEYCAFTAQCIARRQGVDLFEAYLAGLIKEVGIIVALKAMDNIGELDDAPRSINFQRKFAAQALKLSSLIAAEWEFPVNVVTAILEQAEESDPASMSELGSVLYLATLMSQLQLLIEEGHINDDTSLRSCRTDTPQADSCTVCFEELKKYSV